MNKHKLFEINILSIDERVTILKVGHSSKEVYDFFNENKIEEYSGVYGFYVREINNIDGFDIFPIKSGLEKDKYGEQYPTKEMIEEQHSKRKMEMELFKEEIRQVRLEKFKDGR